MIFHSVKSEDIVNELQSDIEQGLSPQQVADAQQKFGLNNFTDKKKKGFVARFIDQMKDVMIIILLIAAAISVLVTLVEGTNDWLEPIIIVAIVLINALLGVIQESRAEAALEALKNLAAPTAKVIRQGKQQTIEATELVPGDIIVIEAGDYIPADARLLETYSLRCDESMLTGESVAAEKDAGIICEDIAPIGDRVNTVFSGCSVAYGRGKAIVTHTGMETEMGKIATVLKGTDDAITPLQTRLANLGKTLGFIALGICAVIFVFGLIKNLPIIEIFMTAISLAVAAIPEGLPAIVTVVLALGVQKMVKKNAIIRRLPAVETLGSASVICSDKTGTLTQNRMTLMKVYSAGRFLDMSEQLPDDAAALIKLGALCCDGSVDFKEGKEVHHGDPTETAIVAAMCKVFNTDKATLDYENPRMCEIPFDSDRKLMTTVCMIDQKPYAIIKGGADIIIERSLNIDKEQVQKAADLMAADALRVLGIALKPLDEVPTNPTVDELEYDLTFVGLVGLIDPPRNEAKLAIKDCKRAGIRTVMITGDHIVTASAIAKQLGILEGDQKAVTGAELEAMTDEQLEDEIENISVYARVSPQDKIRIVQAWQKKGHVVAMTGDGVNDAPALKAADIGCAMGITGTDVAKSAAAMTLTDDNFATIVSAVKQGRGIYENIRKAVHFLLSCNLGEIVTVFICMLIFGVSPLTPIMLLWTNLITDSLPALALGMEPAEKDIMDMKPRHKNEGIFARGLGINAVWQGVMFGVITILAFAIGLFSHGWTFGAQMTDTMLTYAQTMAFAVLSLSQLFHAFNCRSPHSLFYAGWFKNKFMWLAGGISLLLLGAVFFIPALHAMFGIATLKSTEYLEIIGLAIIPLVAVELVKIGTDLNKKFKK